MSQEDLSKSGKSITEEDTESVYEDEEYFCSICNGKYVDGELWLQCDKCSNWFHAVCRNMRKHTKGSLTVSICGNVRNDTVIVTLIEITVTAMTTIVYLAFLALS